MKRKTPIKTIHDLNVGEALEITNADANRFRRATSTADGKSFKVHYALDGSRKMWVVRHK